MINAVGYTTARGIVESVGHSRRAAQAKLARLTGRGALGRGSYSVRQLVRSTGYTREQLRRASSALNQKWKRLDPRGSFLITEEQRDELIAWLAHDYWAPLHRLYCCQHCTTEARPHRSLGLCTRCYHAYVRVCRARGLRISPKSQARALACLRQTDSVPLETLTRMRRGIAVDLEGLEALTATLGGRP